MKKIWKLALIAAVLGALVLVMRGQVTRWANEKTQNEIASWLQEKIKKASENWPIRVVDIRWQASLEDLSSLTIPSLQVRLKNESVEADLDGRITTQFRSPTASWRVVFKGQIRTQVPALDPYSLGKLSSPVTLSIDLAIDDLSWSSLKKGISAEFLHARAELNPPGLQAKLPGNWKADLKEPILTLDVNPETEELPITVAGSLTAASLQVAGAFAEKEFQAEIKPFTLRAQSQDGKTTADLVLGKTEALLGDLFFSAELSKNPVHILHKDQDLEASLLPWIALRQRHLSLKSVSIPWLIELLVQDPLFYGLKSLQIPHGEITANLNLPESGWVPTGMVEIEIPKLGAPEQSMAAKEFQLQAKIQKQKLDLQMSAQKLAYKKWLGELAPTQIQIDYANHRINTSEPGLRFQDLNMSLSPITGTMGPAGFDLGAKVKIAKSDLAKILQKFCVPDAQLFPAQVSSTDLDLRFDSKDFLVTGKIEVSLFGGNAQLTDPAIFTWKSKVPETQFDLEWKDLSLEQLGQFMGFGQMEGTLQGHALDAVLQGDLPTQFDFLIEAKPLKKNSDIVFSPEAMKNVVRLFAGDDLQYLPWYADWLAFGWPSRVLGGFDVLYAGFSAFSQDGSILVETLDPEEIGAKEQKHFFLYGPRFKMPLRTAHYPLMIDAPGISQFVRQVTAQLKNLQLKNEKEKDASHEQKTSQPQLETNCTAEL